jgi:hypothetical protein
MNYACPRCSRPSIVELNQSTNAVCPHFDCMFSWDYDSSYSFQCGKYYVECFLEYKTSAVFEGYSSDGKFVAECEIVFKSTITEEAIEKMLLIA